MSQSPSLSRRVLSKKQAAEFLGISERTLSRRHAEGIGPRFIKHGRKIAYLEDSLFDWLVSNERKGVRQ